ncbi:MAG: DUF1178 family protein [Pseudomonadota bacterium]
MIRYALKCGRGHSFESWFQSAEAYETLQAAGHVSCAVCGSNAVTKAVMAPPVRSGEASQAVQSKPEADLTALRKNIEENATYVGGSFAKEARAMHLGDSPERAIWGEAKPAEAKALLEDGVPVAPLPFMPKNKVN